MSYTFGPNGELIQNGIVVSGTGQEVGNAITSQSMQDKYMQSAIDANNRANIAPTTYGGLTAGDWMTGGGLALSAYNTFGGAQKELAEKQMEGIDANIKLANQQIKSNKQAMADRSQFNNTWANASNGLAASYANRIG